MYGREFVLACDYEPVHWMTYINNPGARLLQWRLRLQDYHYKIEYKQGKLNRGVEAMPGNPVDDGRYSESTDSTDSYESDDSNKFYRFSSTKKFLKTGEIHRKPFKQPKSVSNNAFQGIADRTE